MNIVLAMRMIHRKMVQEQHEYFVHKHLDTNRVDCDIKKNLYENINENIENSHANARTGRTY